MTLLGTWKLDPDHSEVGFSVRHAAVSKVKGKFDVVHASVEHDGTQARVQAVVDAATFNSSNPSRDAHIKSDDFLDVEKYPTLGFTGLYNGNVLKGDLTVHGVTHPVVFHVDFGGEATDPYGQVRAGVEAKTSISRKDFGLTWNAALETGGVLVSDKVDLILDLSFIKQ